MNFETETYGKWILAGEHAVLRGSPALVFPLRSMALKFRVEESQEALQLSTGNRHGKELEPLFWALLQKAGDLAGRQRAELKGRVHLACDIPLGAGLGASAAFCVALTRWLVSLGWVESAQAEEFARSLENLFHGESSGVDIAVSITGHGMHFERNGLRQAIHSVWRPQLYVSYCGQRGMTSEAVNLVKKILQDQPELGRALDEKMKRAALLCETSLQDSTLQGFENLAQGIKLARSCFEHWGLAEGAVNEHLKLLDRLGAQAAKPTGSGGGGYVLSLWSQEPPAELKNQLYFCQV